MSASMTLTGLREIVKAMDALPAGLEDKAGQVVRASAYEAANELRSALALGPSRTVKGKPYAGGNLRKGVRVQKQDTTRYRVISGAPHSWINEEGTGARATKTGANRGVSPASKTVARVASQQRREMNGQLEQVLVQVLGTVR